MHDQHILLPVQAQQLTVDNVHQQEQNPVVLNVQQSQSAPQGQQQQATRNYLNWQQLHRAAQIAAWSGLCYHTPDNLQATIDQRHLPLTLLAQGRNEYTAW